MQIPPLYLFNFFFCLTSTSTNQILHQEPGFSFRTGKIGSTGIFWRCFIPTPEQEHVVPALSLLLCWLFILGIFSRAAFPWVFSGSGRIIQPTESAKMFLCRVWLWSEIPWLLSPALDLPNLCWGWIWGMFEEFFKSSLGSVQGLNEVFTVPPIL